MVANIPDRELESSPFSGHFTRDGSTVEVHIYRFAGTDEDWTLEVVDRVGTSTVFTELFSDDQDAYDTFMRAIAEDGIASFSDGEPVQH